MIGDLNIFNAARLNLVNGVHDLDTHVFKVAIIDNTLAPVVAAVAPKLSDYTEVIATGTYTAGGTALTISLTESAGVITFDATNDPSWLKDALNSTTAYWALIYNDTDATDQALGFIDLNGPLNMVTDDLTITWHPNGLFSIQVIT